MDIADDDENGDDEDNTNDNYNELFSFIEEIYKNCIKLGIPPAIIPLWIKNLFDFKSLIDIDKNRRFMMRMML